MLLRTTIFTQASRAALSAALLASAGAASAQGAASAAGAPVSLDTIVVTAQKRVQNLQDVPIVVNVVGKQLLQDSGVHDIKDLSTLTPGLTVTSTTSAAATTARIRGVGTVGDNPGLEPAVGVVIDGVYRPRTGVGFSDLGDVDRIEVLKGPQGTLFGKSTSAGVINIITAQPAFKFGSNAEFTAGNYGAFGGALGVTGPLVGDKLAASLYFADRQRNGFYKVVTGMGPRTETQDENQNFYTLRGQLLYKPDNNLTARIIGDYTHHDESCCVGVQYTSGGLLDAHGDTPQSITKTLGGAGGGESQSPNPYNRTAYANQAGIQDVVDMGVSAQIDYKMPSLGATLTSVTALRRWELVSGGDSDFTNADLLYRPNNNSNSERFDDFSQEIRLAGAYGRIDYLVGAFYSHEALRYNYSLLNGTQYTAFLSDVFGAELTGAPNPLTLQGLFGPKASFPAGQGSVDRYHQRDNTYAVFSNDTLHVTSKFDINLGIRYTIDDKDLVSNNSNIGAAQACAAVTSAPLVHSTLFPASVLQTAVDAVCIPSQDPAFNTFNNKQSSSEKEVSGTAKLVYRLDPRLLTYASYARGYKAGGFNLDRVACPNETGCAKLPNGVSVDLTPKTDTSFRPEFSDSYELGAKSTLFQRRLVLNAALFYEKFTDFQLNTFNGLVFVVDSVPTVYSAGLDTDFAWRPLRSLVIQGGVTVADTRFSRADQATLLREGFLGSASARLPLAPAYSSALSGTYTYDLPGDYALHFNLGSKFTSQTNTGSDLDPRKVQKAFTITDGRVTFGPKSGRYDIELWSQNLFDVRYVQTIFDAPAQNVPSNAKGELNAFLGAPRTFGVTVRGKF